MLVVSRSAVDVLISLTPGASSVTSFFRAVKLKLVVQLKLGLVILKLVRENSKPLLYIEPTLAGIELPGIPFEGAWGTFRIRLLTSL